jgi:hypothetical protein
VAVLVDEAAAGALAADSAELDVAAGVEAAGAAAPLEAGATVVEASEEALPPLKSVTYQPEPLS